MCAWVETLGLILARLHTQERFRVRGADAVARITALMDATEAQARPVSGVGVSGV